VSGDLALYIPNLSTRRRSVVNVTV